MPDDDISGHSTRITLRSDPMAVRDGLQTLFATLMLRGLDTDARGTAEIVLAEALNNIVEHAYSSGEGEIELTITVGDGEMTCRIMDQGRPMPDDRLPEGRMLPPDNLPEGGFGWFLIRSLSQDLAYDRIGGRNLLSFRLCMGQSAA